MGPWFRGILYGLYACIASDFWMPSSQHCWHSSGLIISIRWQYWSTPLFSSRNLFLRHRGISHYICMEFGWDATGLVQIWYSVNTFLYSVMHDTI
jgi:hypothetical protein